jgi:8-oxo-dGTP pyrophosphatase MutT (NUDIX family)
MRSDPSIRRVAAAVIQRSDGKLLLLKRAPTHMTFPGQWCFVTGYVESNEQPRSAAIRELREELGVDALPVQEGRIVIVHTERGTIHVYPFLFRVDDFVVKLDWEHVDYRWIEAREIHNYDHVPQIDEDLAALGLL